MKQMRQWAVEHTLTAAIVAAGVAMLAGFAVFPSASPDAAVLGPLVVACAAGMWVWITFRETKPPTRSEDHANPDPADSTEWVSAAAALAKDAAGLPDPDSRHWLEEAARHAADLNSLLPRDPKPTADLCDTIAQVTVAVATSVNACVQVASDPTAYHHPDQILSLGRDEFVAYHDWLLQTVQAADRDDWDAVARIVAAGPGADAV